jgi:hypothetical protein
LTLSVIIIKKVWKKTQPELTDITVMERNNHNLFSVLSHAGSSLAQELDTPIIATDTFHEKLGFTQTYPLKTLAK